MERFSRARSCNQVAIDQPSFSQADTRNSLRIQSTVSVDEIVLLKEAHQRLSGDFDDRVLRLRILDPAMGSGHFLLSVCKLLAERATNPLTRDHPKPGRGRRRRPAVSRPRRRPDGRLRFRRASASQARSTHSTRRCRPRINTVCSPVRRSRTAICARSRPPVVAVIVNNTAWPPAGFLARDGGFAARPVRPRQHGRFAAGGGDPLQPSVRYAGPWACAARRAPVLHLRPRPRRFPAVLWSPKNPACLAKYRTRQDRAPCPPPRSPVGVGRR